MANYTFLYVLTVYVIASEVDLLANRGHRYCRFGGHCWLRYDGPRSGRGDNAWFNTGACNDLQQHHFKYCTLCLIKMRLFLFLKHLKTIIYNILYVVLDVRKPIMEIKINNINFQQEHRYKITMQIQENNFPEECKYV